MTDWSGFRDTLLAAVSPFAAANVPVLWEHASYVNAAQHVLLDVVSSVEISTRETLISPGGGALPIKAWSIVRDVTVQFKGESDEDPSVADALFTLDPIRFGMFEPEFATALGADIIPEFDLLPTLTPLRYTGDSRTVSVYVFESVFRACFDHQPGNSSDVIETANLNYNLTLPSP